MTYKLLCHKQILNDRPSVGVSQHRRAGPFGVRHHAEYVALPVADARDVPNRSIRIGGRSYFPVLVAIPENDLAICFQLIQGLRVGIVASLAMGYGYFVDRILLILDEDILANELLMGVAQQGARQQTRLT